MRISERSGRGVNKIVSVYGKKAFLIEQDFIKVTIPYLRLIAHKSSISEQKNNKKVSKKVSKSEKNIQRILAEIRNNPNITTNELIIITNLKKTSIQKYIRILEGQGKLKRSGSKKLGTWVIEDDVDIK